MLASVVQPVLGTRRQRAHPGNAARPKQTIRPRSGVGGVLSQLQKPKNKGSECKKLKMWWWVGCWREGG